MKNYIIILFFFVLIIGKSNIVNSQTIDTTAIRIVESSLMSVEKYLRNSKEDSSRLMGRAIWFLTEVTGIPSRSDGNFLGQFSPTWLDYYNWKNWIVLNKKFLFWDNEKKIIVIHKTVNALEENIPMQK